MPNNAPVKVDLRALIQDRKAKNARQSVRATICFDPDLLARLNELNDEANERRLRRQENDTPDPDPRLGRRDTLSAQIAELEKQVAATSVVAVFRVPTRERQAEINKLAENGEEVDTLMVSDCFAHFLDGNEPIPGDQLGRAELEDWLVVASRGEVNAISYAIAARSLGTPDFPASVKRSLQTRHSDGK